MKYQNKIDYNKLINIINILYKNNMFFIKNMSGDIFPIDIGKLFIKDITTENGYNLLREEIYKKFPYSKRLPFKIFQNNEEIDLNSKETKKSKELLNELDIFFINPTLLFTITHSNYKFFIFVDDISDSRETYNTYLQTYSFYYNKNSKEYSDESFDYKTKNIEELFNILTISNSYEQGEEYRIFLIEKMLKNFEHYKNKYDI